MSRIKRKSAIHISELLQEYIRVNKLDQGLDRTRVFRAWADASGAEDYTVKKFYRSGTLYITVSSSVVCSQLSFQKTALIEKINHILGSNLVSELILK